MAAEQIDESPEWMDQPLYEELTKSECITLRLAAAGYSYKEIGKIRHLAESTIGNQMWGICGKLHVSNRVQAVVEAYRRGLIALPPPHPDRLPPALMPRVWRAMLIE